MWRSGPTATRLPVRLPGPPTYGRVGPRPDPARGRFSGDWHHDFSARQRSVTLFRPSTRRSDRPGQVEPCGSEGPIDSETTRTRLKMGRLDLPNTEGRKPQRRQTNGNERDGRDISHLRRGGTHGTEGLFWYSGPIDGDVSSGGASVTVGDSGSPERRGHQTLEGLPVRDKRR